MEGKKRICVKVYYNEAEFADVVREAEKAGIRRVGLKLRLVKSHGFMGETLANTKGIAKFLKKKCFVAWKEGEADRMARAAAIKAQEQALAKEKAKLGIT